MDVTKYIRDTEPINELLNAINNKAKEAGSYEYGLPTYDNDAMAGLREVVLKWLVEQ